VTLIHVASGNEIPMGTAFDTFSTAAHTKNARGGFAENRKASADRPRAPRLPEL
jgi:D-alanyl-D-alanine dipeptidase